MLSNEAYLDRLGISSNPNVRRGLLETMKAYGELRWWLAVDDRVLAYHQLFEQVLLVKFEVLHAGLEHLLLRPVLTHELALGLKELQREAQRAWGQLSYGDPR